MAIACGGTGGHLFPGVAVAEQLQQRGCAISLLVSPKDVDQRAVQGLAGIQVVTLPAVGLMRGRLLAFVLGFAKSYVAAKRYFTLNRPACVLAMGGFTSAPPVLAGRRSGARTFLHESNTIPGRANRWLARAVDGAFVGFPETAGLLRNRTVTCTGTPVRSRLTPRDPAACRIALGLEADRRTLLVVGGSQGAAGINDLVIRTLPHLAVAIPDLQLIHLAGPVDADRVRAAARHSGVPAAVHPFFGEMELALGAATVAVSRAGASSLAEFAAIRLPPVLVPFPAATDNHQLRNAQAFAEAGAARVLEQHGATPEQLATWIVDWMSDAQSLERARSAIGLRHAPHAARQIADLMLSSIVESNPETVFQRADLRRPRSRHDSAPGSRCEVSV
jgi:UDP-N-acetylglucosamine--N-acetylmuramyl-(pentapeptide) pyrophosphoryl-undecaprenol N-acetylglucosamine transferase